jgi:hypothetical protein
MPVKSLPHAVGLSKGTIRRSPFEGADTWEDQFWAPENRAVPFLSLRSVAPGKEPVVGMSPQARSWLVLKGLDRFLSLKGMPLSGPRNWGALWHYRREGKPEIFFALLNKHANGAVRGCGPGLWSWQDEDAFRKEADRLRGLIMADLAEFMRVFGFYAKPSDVPDQQEYVEPPDGLDLVDTLAGAVGCDEAIDVTQTAECLGLVDRAVARGYFDIAREAPQRFQARMQDIVTPWNRAARPRHENDGFNPFWILEDEAVTQAYESRALVNRFGPSLPQWAYTPAETLTFSAGATYPLIPTEPNWADVRLLNEPSMQAEPAAGTFYCYCPNEDDLRQFNYQVGDLLDLNGVAGLQDGGYRIERIIGWPPEPPRLILSLLPRTSRPLRFDWRPDRYLYINGLYIGVVHERPEGSFSALANCNVLTTHWVGEAFPTEIAAKLAVEQFYLDHLDEYNALMT